VPINPSALSSALIKWAEALGTSSVITSAETLVRAETATFPTSSRVAAILQPATRGEVQTCLRIANECRVPVYPTSTGRNWGYGSGAPVSDAVLLSLAGLNHIVDFDERLAYVTLEPGVTQRQLFNYLRSRGSRLWMDATGASPESSVIGNTLERGFGHTPMGDHAATACGLEVVLATGDCIETGFGRFGNPQVAAVSRWGLGPSLDGLFSQANLGVVTRMTVWLMPAPEFFQAFFLQSDSDVATLVDALQPLRLDGTLRSVVHLGNDYKIIANPGEYPWDRTAGDTPLGAPAVEALRRERRIGRWNASGGLYGTRSHVRAARQRLRRGLTGKVRRLVFVSDRSLDFIRKVQKPYRRLTRRSDFDQAINVLPPLIGLLKGIPTDAFLRSAYWRKRTPIPADPDPDRDGCGLLWCSPVAPAAGRHVGEITDLASRLVLGHGLEPLISVSLITERSAITTIALTYDRQKTGEDERAMRCYRELTEQLLGRGYPPYRLNVAAMNYMRAGESEISIIRALKRTLDPNNILAPGRYEVSGE
jgi:4-cresol dehydrogenase (hydroxylating)